MLEEGVDDEVFMGVCNEMLSVGGVFDEALDLGELAMEIYDETRYGDI